MQEKKVITKKSGDFSKWYIDVIKQADLADYGPVKGTMVFKPYGYALWEGIKRELDAKIRAMGVDNAYFPLFIPESYLEKEKDHVEGFSPELAVVTIGGGKKLEEPVIVRPTSETVIYAMFAKWIQSWRDLPLKMNQWCNVVRWEKRTLPFIRTTEFLWQEGHTAHATHEEALVQVGLAIEAYAEVYREHLAMAGVAGYKSESEKFAGAVKSVSYESLMPDGKALQSCTSHDLGQNFSRVFDITFQNKEGKEDYVWQTSWGFSTRSIGGLIMVHGDDNGLVLPPKVSPVQVVIVPIQSDRPEVKEFSDKAFSALKEKFRVHLDDRAQYTPGWKYNEWELKGVPLRLEIGPREAEKDEVVMVRRDTFTKESVPVAGLAERIDEMLLELQRAAFERSRTFMDKNTREAGTYEEFKKIMAGPRGFIRAFWCEDAECEAKIKQETKATTRCLPLDAKEEKGKCVHCGSDATHRWLFAQAY
ncbi:proline--tRNA ligase [Patescibacteria group bacterium]|nr:proline--tRNA ligase [Patescibacteria group bacterium]MBU1868065.1 proline--tRNA ligase [Patescibacteria group bacterium]